MTSDNSSFRAMYSLNKRTSFYSYLLVMPLAWTTKYLAAAMPPAPGFNGTYPNVSSYCGFLDRNTFNPVCDPKGTVCVDDSNCTGLLNYTSCLRECGPQISFGNENSVTGCLLSGDMMFAVNQSVGIIGYQCYDKGRYAGLESFCGSNGSLFYVENNFTCPDYAPYCFQCGKAGPHAAVCTWNFDAGSEGCVTGGSVEDVVEVTHQGSNESGTTANGCLVGDIMYQVNQSIGYIGFLCRDNSTFLGKESFCGNDGSIHEVNKTISCPEKSPFCFQCGMESYGAAICLSNFTFADEGCVWGGSAGSFNNGTEILSTLQNVTDSLFGGANYWDNMSNVASTVENILGSNFGESDVSNLPFVGSSGAGADSGRTGSSSVTASTSDAHSAHLDYLPISALLVWITFAVAIV